LAAIILDREMTEDKYKKIFDDYLTDKSDVDDFIDRFMNQWREDRDKKEDNDSRFQRLIDRVFISCDCYSATPEGQFEIVEKQLKDEVGLLTHIWFG
jgi:hypothetical protein